MGPCCGAEVCLGDGVRTASPAWRLNGGRGGTEGAPHGKSPSQREDGQEKISPFFRNGLDFANLFQ